MGRPLWSPPPGKLDKPALPARCDLHTLPASISHLPPPNPSRSTPSTWAPDYSPSSSSSSSYSSSSSGIGLRHSRLTDDDQQRRALHRGDGLVMRSDSSMLTLDEFLRETSAASATRDEAERYLNNLLSLQRVSPGIGTGRRADWASISPTDPETDPIVGSAPWRALVEHTPAGRARILGALPGGASERTASAPDVGRLAQQAGGSRSVPYTYTPLPANGQDSFDTLVGQIRRIGALQDYMLSSVGEVDSAVATNAAAIAEAALEEEEAASMVIGAAPAVVAGAVAEGSGEEGERNAVAALRVREARLRAMQTRIDLLASEFALLRDTRRELRRVEAEALSTLQNASARNTAAVAALTTVPISTRASSSRSAAPRTQAAEALSIFQTASARNTTAAALPTLPSRSAATRTQTAVDRYVLGRHTLPEHNLREGRASTHSHWPGTRHERAEWGRQGSGNREGDEEERVARWTIMERDQVLRREVLQMEIERLPVGGI